MLQSNTGARPAERQAPSDDTGLARVGALIATASPRAVSRSKAAPYGALCSAVRARFAAQMVGRVRVELTTSRLSGVRSNHLSYRTKPCPRTRQAQQSCALWARLAALAELAADRIGYADASALLRFPVMKGHEDGGNVLWKR